MDKTHAQTNEKSNAVNGESVCDWSSPLMSKTILKEFLETAERYVHLIKDEVFWPIPKN